MTTWTAKVGLRKPTGFGHPLAYVHTVLKQIRSESQAAELCCGVAAEPACFEMADVLDGWFRDQVTRAADVLDGLPPEMVETMAHRTAVRAAHKGACDIGGVS